MQRGYWKKKVIIIFAFFFLIHGSPNTSIIHSQRQVLRVKVWASHLCRCSRIPVLGKGYTKHSRVEAGQEAISPCHVVISFTFFPWQTLQAPQHLFSPSSLPAENPSTQTPESDHIFQAPSQPDVCGHKHVTTFQLTGYKQRWKVSLKEGRCVCPSSFQLAGLQCDSKCLSSQPGPWGRKPCIKDDGAAKQTKIFRHLKTVLYSWPPRSFYMHEN